MYEQPALFEAFQTCGCGTVLIPGTRYPSDEQDRLRLCKTCRNERTKMNPNFRGAQQRWYLKNRDKILAQQREYVAANSEARAAYRRIWNAAHTEEALDRWLVREARKRDNGPVEKIDRRAVWGRDEGHCRIGLLCGGAFVPFDAMELDHIVPISRGGTHTWNNVQTACNPCNRRKYNRMPDELAA